MSSGDISSIIRRETGEDEEQNRIRMSKASQALNLFEKGNTPVQVAIKLDIETGEVDRLYMEYGKLKGLNIHFLTKSVNAWITKAFTEMFLSIDIYFSFFIRSAGILNVALTSPFSIFN